MSLGWQSESALLPSKAKPINVDGKSMLSLKAIVYDTERQLSSKNGNQEGSGLNRVKVHPSSSKRDDFGGNKANKRERVFPTRLEKSSQDSNTSVVDNRETRVDAALRAKAALYDQIKCGNIDGENPPLSYRSAATGAGLFLVDFEGKRKSSRDHDPESLVNDSDERDTKLSRLEGPSRGDTTESSVKASDLVEICDEFGRNRWVSRYSREYQKYLLNWKPPVSDEQEAVKRYSSQNSSSGDQQWQWSTGQGHAGTEDWKRDLVEQRGLKALVEDRVEKEIRLSDAARVKTQWEKTLYNSARDFLDDIHKDSSLKRAAGGQAEYSTTEINSTQRGDAAALGMTRSDTVNSANAVHSVISAAAVTATATAAVSESAASRRLEDRRELLRQKKLKAQQRHADT
jgi:hypothetical protein